MKGKGRTRKTGTWRRISTEREGDRDDKEIRYMVEYREEEDSDKEEDREDKKDRDRGRRGQG